MNEPKYAADVRRTRPDAVPALSDASPTVPLAPTVPEAAKFVNTAADAVFAGVFLAVGWLFWDLQLWWTPYRWALPGMAGTAVFTLLFAAAVLSYLFVSGTLPARESWFWLAIMLGLGFSYLLPYGGSLVGSAQYFALLVVAQYWTAAAGGRLYKEGKTSNWLVVDVFHALFVAPWGNFGRLFAVLWEAYRRGAQKRRAARAEQTRSETARHMVGLLGGIAGAAVCLCMVMPLLMAADDGFAAVFSGLWDALGSLNGRIFQNFGEWMLKTVLAVPTACYLYGLVYAAVKGRYMSVFERRDVCVVQRGVRTLPRVTVGMVLGVLAGVYVLFIAMQARYLFGAFWGALPDGFTYAEYARQGFFELCRVAAINAVILILANVFSKHQPGEWRALRLLNGGLAGLTLLLLVTAAAKMTLYIGVYGFTVKRILASTALLWLLIVFLLVLARQARPVPLVRTAVLTGALLFTLLCCLPIESAAENYNQTYHHQGGAAPLTPATF